MHLIRSCTFSRARTRASSLPWSFFILSLFSFSSVDSYPQQVQTTFSTESTNLSSWQLLCWEDTFIGEGDIVVLAACVDNIDLSSSGFANFSKGGSLERLSFIELLRLLPLCILLNLCWHWLLVRDCPTCFAIYFHGSLSFVSLPCNSAFSSK